MDYHIKARWNPEHNEQTRVILNKNFMALSPIEKLDFLKDTMLTLNQAYGETIAELQMQAVTTVKKNRRNRR